MANYWLRKRGSCGIQNALGGDELTSPVLKKIPTCTVYMYVQGIPFKGTKVHNISSEIERSALKLGPSSWEINKIIQKHYPNLGSWVAYTIPIPISWWTWWDANLLMHLLMLTWRGGGELNSKHFLWESNAWSEENAFSTPPIKTRGQMCFIESSNIL